MTRSERSQRSAARAAIALFTLFALVVLAFPGASFGEAAYVDQTSTPTPSRSPSQTGSPSARPSGSGSPSASPSGTAVPQPIQFLNPSSHSRVVSNKNDGTNATYHLVAVLREPPPSPIVEFKYQQGTGNEVSIGLAARVGSTDTFELEWNLGALTDGSYTLKAVLYVGGAEIGRDEVTATVNNADSLTDPTAETVEIVGPRNGQPAGFYQPPAARVAHTVVDATASAASAPPSTSAGTAMINVLFTKTPVGLEPVWVACGSASRAATGPTSIRCTLREGDRPAEVTALAAVANSPAAQLVAGSGDAHRVFPYTQVPTVINLEPREQSNKPAAACADAVTATVLDQNGAKIAGVNTDVHAKGPTDNLLFDDTGNNSSAHQPPDKAHTQPENTRDCEGSGQSGTQGQHEFAPGNPDLKHIETTAVGTNEAGQFRFQLFSPDQGTTDFAVWADTDDDDLWCTEETAARGSVQWSQSASPAPTASGSPSGSPSSSPSGSPSGSARPTGSARPSGTPSGTARPEPTTLEPDTRSCPPVGGSPTPTQTAGANRSVTLTASRRSVAYGGAVSLRGRIQSDNTACEDNEVVEIRRRIHGTETFRDFRTTASDAGGDFSVRTKPAKSADYQAVLPPEGACDEAASSATTVMAKVRVTSASSSARASSGDDVTISGKVSPNHRGSKVVLQRKKGARWVKVARDGLNRRSRYSFSVEVDWDGKRRFRVRWASQDDDHAAGTSPKVVVTAT